MAAIKALEALKEPCQVTLVSDSEYVVNGITKGWARGWRAKGWRRSGKTVPNWELWRQLLELCEYHRVRFEWVRGHAGHVENERCDALAVAAAGGSDLPADPGYEQPPAPPAQRRPACSIDRRSRAEEEGADEISYESRLVIETNVEGSAVGGHRRVSRLVAG